MIPFLTDMVIEDFSFQAKNLSFEITRLLNEENIDLIARETGFVQRKRKLSGFEFLDMLLFTQFNHKELSLNDLSIQLLLRYGVEISSQSIDERFTDLAVIFFKTILKRLLKKAVLQDRKQSINFTKFNRIRIKDSTSFQLPKEMKGKYKGSGGGSSAACIRIQFEYDLKSGDILDLSLNPFNVQDTTNAGETINEINSNELVIRDLGYIKIGHLMEIQKKEAFYLNRFHSGTNAYELKDGKYVNIDFYELCKEMKKNRITCMEKDVYLGSKEKFKSRIIIEVLPDDRYQERIRKVKQKARKSRRNVGNAIVDYNMVEESVKKSSSWVVFEPNDANTWARVKAMIVNYLTTLWRQGALAGPTPEAAFFVKVGLGETMTPLDILEGRMNIEIGMAAVRPAEFIILKFSHKLQEA